jgi:hypothetical protein
MGKLDRIARAFGYHAHSMQLSAKEGQPQDFQTDPLPNLRQPKRPTPISAGVLGKGCRTKRSPCGVRSVALAILFSGR